MRPQAKTKMTPATTSLKTRCQKQIALVRDNDIGHGEDNEQDDGDDDELVVVHGNQKKRKLGQPVDLETVICLPPYRLNTTWVRSYMEIPVDQIHWIRRHFFDDRKRVYEYHDNVGV